MTTLQLENPQQTIDQVVTFIRHTFEEQGMTKGIIAVSGGIDSALALTLLTQAIGPGNVTTLFLPYHDQATTDNKLVADFAQVPTPNQLEININTMVDAAVYKLELTPTDKVRFGNLQARARMTVLYDQAKKLGALVCGTENKSEKHLGYFTRFGDAAADLDPISHLYKTQVRQLAQQLQLPAQILEKAPSAGLWNEQTDETELGFSYDEADQVLFQLIDQHQAPAQVRVEGVTPEKVKLIIERVTQNKFKQLVPYILQK